MPETYLDMLLSLLYLLETAHVVDIHEESLVQVPEFLLLPVTRVQRFEVFRGFRPVRHVGRLGCHIWFLKRDSC